MSLINCSVRGLIETRLSLIRRCCGWRWSALIDWKNQESGGLRCWVLARPVRCRINMDAAVVTPHLCGSPAIARKHTRLHAGLQNHMLGRTLSLTHMHAPTEARLSLLEDPYSARTPTLHCAASCPTPAENKRQFSGKQAGLWMWANPPP